jgi:hypothetical protein
MASPTKRPPLTIVYEYEPDPARCAAALAFVLSYSPKNANAGAANPGGAADETPPQHEGRISHAS